MESKIYKEGAGDVTFLKEKRIAIIGYGNQGRAQALNLKDTGLQVIIGNRKDEYKERALADGFQTFPIPEAIKLADIIFLLLPDEILPTLFDKEIVPNLKENSCLVCAHGYNIAFHTITPPENVDVILIAPRMIGIGVRENYLNREGFYSFIAIHQDYTGEAEQILFGLCEGLGTLKKGVVMLSFKQEAVLDLFNEQAFGPAFGRLLLSSIFTLVDAGYPLEAVFIEMFLSGEMEYTYEKFRKIGLVEQTNLHSHTSQYGAMSRAIKFLNLPISKTQKKILKNIEDGDFAKEWERPWSKIKFKFLKFFATRTRINRLEKKVRENLGLPDTKYFEIDDNILKKRKELNESQKKELKEFEEFYEEY